MSNQFLVELICVFGSVNTNSYIRVLYRQTPNNTDNLEVLKSSDSLSREPASAFLSRKNTVAPSKLGKPVLEDSDKSKFLVLLPKLFSKSLV